MTRKDFLFKFWNKPLYDELLSSGYNVTIEGRTYVLDYSKCEGQDLTKLKAVMDRHIPDGSANITKAM